MAQETTPKKAKVRELVITCQVCRKPVTGTTGHLWMSDAAVSRVQQNRAEAPALMSFRDLEMIQPANWQAHHKACSPDPDADGYGIEAGRIETVAELLEWTAHMMEKRCTWLCATDWPQVLRGIDTPGSRLSRVQPAG